jgi:hypothetical protein
MEKLSRVFPLLRVFELDKGEEFMTDEAGGPFLYSFIAFF